MTSFMDGPGALFHNKLPKPGGHNFRPALKIAELLLIGRHDGCHINCLLSSGLVPVVNNDETFTEFYNNIDWKNEFNSSLWSTLSWETQTSYHIITFRSRDVGTMNGEVLEEKCRP